MGFFKKMFRKRYGRASGFNFKGERDVTIEDNKVVLYVIGADDIVISKADVASFELSASGVQVADFSQQGKIAVANTYTIVLKNGVAGSLTVYAGEAHRFLNILK